MQLRRDFLLSVGVLVAFNVLLAFGAIGLLTRMSPAIARILRENVYSNAAVEEMLALLAEPEREDTLEIRRQRFEQALQRARNNVTEPEETPVLERIAQYSSAAVAGDARATVTVVQALQHLAAINRQAMVMADQEAQRLGTAGAWVAVFIAAIAFVMSLIVIRRLERHVINPLVELYDVLDTVRTGNPHRRCRMVAAPEEIRRVLSSVNALLDGRNSPPSREMHAHMASERGALLHFLEQHPHAMVLVDAHGDIVAANSRGLALLGSSEGERFKQLLGKLPAESLQNDHIAPIVLPGTAGWLVSLQSSVGPYA